MYYNNFKFEDDNKTKCEEILSFESCEPFKMGIKMGGRMVMEMFFGDYLTI